MTNTIKKKLLKIRKRTVLDSGLDEKSNSIKSQKKNLNTTLKQDFCFSGITFLTLQNFIDKYRSSMVSINEE